MDGPCFATPAPVCPRKGLPVARQLFGGGSGPASCVLPGLRGGGGGFWAGAQGPRPKNKAAGAASGPARFARPPPPQAGQDRYEPSPETQPRAKRCIQAQTSIP